MKLHDPRSINEAINIRCNFKDVWGRAGVEFHGSRILRRKQTLHNFTVPWCLSKMRPGNSSCKQMDHVMPRNVRWAKQQSRHDDCLRIRWECRLKFVPFHRWIGETWWDKSSLNCLFIPRVFSVGHLRIFHCIGFFLTGCLTFNPCKKGVWKSLDVVFRKIEDFTKEC